MRLRTGIFAFVVTLSLIVVAPRPVGAADSEAMVQQLTALNKSAIGAYSDGDFDKAKKLLLQAVALAKKDPSLQTHPLMGRTYLHLGVLYVDGFEDRKAGIRYFTKAIQIRSDIKPAESMATKTVKSAFEEAANEAGESGNAVADSAETAGDDSVKETKGSKAAAAREERASRDDEKRAAAEEKKQADGESRQREKQAQAEKEKLLKDLAVTEGNQAKERAAREKLQTEKQQKDKLLAEAKEALLTLQKGGKEAAAEKEKLTKELAAVKDSEAKERAAKEKLLTEKVEKEKLLTEAKATIAQLQKEKADKEKALADTGAREKKEKEAREKLEKEKQAAAERDKERKLREDTEKAEREKLAAGPDVPAHFTQPIYCAVPDEAQAGSDLYVHCVAQPNLKAKELAFFYRQNGGINYNSVSLEQAKKGWQLAVIPGEKLTGKMVQYYVEARTDRGAVAAANGKANSPNILTLKPAAGAAGAAHSRAKAH